MAQLIFSLSTQKTLVVPLEEGAVTLGRSAENTVQIDEPSISRRHARLTRAPAAGDDAWTVEDLDSVNGIRRNGVRVTAAVTLQNGDRLEFGSVQASYQAAEPPLPPDEHPTIGGEAGAVRVLARIYRLDASLGEGPGFKSYRARDLARQRQVSIKLISSAALRSAEAHARLEQAIEHLLNAPHPNIVSPLRLEHDGEEMFLVSEWIDGPPLLDLLRRQRALAVREALRLLAQAAAALDHARAHGLPDLDLTPGAILLAPTAGGEPAAAPLDKPLDQWPPFVLKLAPLLLEPQVEVEIFDDDPATVFSSAMVASEAYPHGGMAFVLSTLVCEMLGHPLAAGSAAKPPRIIGLGEAGNAMLRRGFVQGSSFPGGREFCAALAAATGVALED